MVLRPESIKQRLKELDEILQELNKYRQLDEKSMRENLSQRWIIERGLIAAAAIILDIAEFKIATGQFGYFLRALSTNQRTGGIS